MKPLFRTILVPHDLSEHANRALALAIELATTHRGRVHVLHALTPFEPVLGFPDGIPWSIPVDDILKTARHTLERMVAGVVGRRRLRFECEVVLGTPFDRIMSAAQRADSIVHVHGRPDRALASGHRERRGEGGAALARARSHRPSAGYCQSCAPARWHVTLRQSPHTVGAAALSLSSSGCSSRPRSSSIGLP